MSFSHMDRQVTYLRHEFHRDPEERSAPLWAFIFDIPYLAACDVFPPFHLLNERLMSGGGDGGMGPGASWAPFTLSRGEYDDLLLKILNPDRIALQSLVRYPKQSFVVDPEFDVLTDFVEWMTAVCGKRGRPSR